MTGSSTWRAHASSSSSATSTCRSVNEFADGGLHPGYAFPLWQAFLALIAKVAFVDPSKVVLHEATVLAPLAVLAVYEAGYGLFRRVVPAAATAGAAVGIAAMAAGHGGSFTSLALPATASRQLLVPAALALAFTAVRAPTRGLLASAGAASLVLAVVHPTYAIFLWIPFAGFLAVRWAWRLREGRQRLAHSRGAGRAGRALPRLAPARRPQDGVGQPRRATSARGGSSTTPASSTARPISSGSRRRCSAAPAQSLSPRCS